MEKINSFIIGGIERQIKIKYDVIRDFLEKSQKVDIKKITLFQSHDWTLSAVMKMLEPNPFKSIDELRDCLDWEEFKVIDEKMADIITGGTINPPNSSGTSIS